MQEQHATVIDFETRRAQRDRRLGLRDSEPLISKAELAKRLAKSTATITRWMREMPDDCYIKPFGRQQSPPRFYWSRVMAWLESGDAA